MTNYLKYGKSNYDKFPTFKIKAPTEKIFNNYDDIAKELNNKIQTLKKSNLVIAFDFYYGVETKEIETQLIPKIKHSLLVNTSEAKLSETETRKWLDYWLTDDRIFGHMSNIALEKYFDKNKLQDFRKKISQHQGVTLVYNVGASLFAKADIIVYFDMPRWEIQKRQRSGQDNWDAKNFQDDPKLKYKRSYFIEWRSFDSHKQKIFNQIDYWFDNTRLNQPKMVNGQTYREGLNQLTKTPFRVVPFFDPGVWGGQWMKEIMDLDPQKINYAWCFDFVPEENSLLFEINGEKIETPAINTVLYEPEEFLGEDVYCRFGAEWPIRSDLLDCIEGQNLSLHLHPLTEYMYKNFGLTYTQDESYYILDGLKNQSVYLGFKNNVSKAKLKSALDDAHYKQKTFESEKFVNKLKTKTHDHLMIPAGTPHCAGKDTMVLEISATPYIFTLRLWDWGRVDFDGKPRNIYVEEALENAQLKFDEKYTQKELSCHSILLQENEDFKEEKTGLHQREFIETHRFTFKKKMKTKTGNNFNLIHLVEGPTVVIKPMRNEFEPFELHYAEVVAIPAQIREYEIIAKKEENYCGEYKILKSYVRVKGGENEVI